MTTYYIRVQIRVPKTLFWHVTGHPGQLSLAIHPWAGAVSTSQWAMMLCVWELKAGMAGVTDVISEHFTGVYDQLDLALYRYSFHIYFSLFSLDHSSQGLCAYVPLSPSSIISYWCKTT